MRSAWKSFRRVLKYAFLFLFGAILLFLVAITFFEQPVPRSLLAKLTDSLSSDEWLVSAKSASFRLSNGLKVYDLRLYNLDRRKPASDPVLEAKQVDLKLNLLRLPWSMKTILKHVTVTGLKYPRLPEGYYIPDSIEFPGQPDFREKDEPLALSIPDMRPFGVTLIQPNILDVKPEKVEIKQVALTPAGIAAKGFHLTWSDADTPMALDGECALDLEAQLVSGEVHGLARQDNVRPLLTALEITNSYAFIDGFTQVTSPVVASCAFDVNLRNNDLHLLLGLHPTGGRYNNIPLAKADGDVDIRVFVRDTFQNARIVVGPVTANLTDGNAMTGTIIYENTNDIGYVFFKDIRSTTSLSNALAIAEVMNDGTLDCLSLATPPLITLDGRLAVNPAYAATNHLDGTLAFESGTFFSIPLTNAATAFCVRGTDVTFSNARASVPHGGTITGEGRISIPDFKQENASFSISLKGESIPLVDFADVFGFDVGDRHGSIFGNVTLSGPLQTNLASRIRGSGHIECRDGYLAQMHVFAGLTDFLAAHVPGIASFVNQSRGSMDFTLTNGVFRTDNIRIEGGFFSIHAAGKYDIPKDDLDFSARITLTKNEGFFATLAKPITWSFGNLTKILFDFKIRGPLEKPVWKYNKSLLDRLK